jgi:two-component sensor histidine kinase
MAADPYTQPPVEEHAARVPSRVVVISICGVWLCYFVLASLRGAVVGLDFSWAYLSRRLLVMAASIAVTGALWPLLRLLDARPLWVKACATLVGALPAALLLSAINQQAFAGLDTAMTMQMHRQASGRHDAVRIQRDDEGNVLVDLAPAPPPLPSTAASDTPIPVPPTPPRVITTGRNSVTITTKAIEDTRPAGGDGSEGGDGRLAMLTDFALGRYFLLLAWAALYIALVNAEQARCAERREGEYRRAAEASELRSLRYQVNPHFLFNTLNSLSALVMTGRLDDAETMIQTLSTFYRRTLSGDPTGDLPLASEVELQQLYLDIEAVRFPSRLRRAVDLPPHLAEAMIPGMILQPLVENSVKYAVAASIGAVTVTIAAHEERGRLVLSVTDSGSAGEGTGDGAMGLRSGTGIGLANVRDRLGARFGEDAMLEAAPVPGGGYRTVLKMPLVFRSLDAGQAVLAA